ncbi:MAG: 2-polyprenyl-3-methyl-5-hydroxy-6-metoxy,4-benzoquinol methylase [Pseudomonadota bacterium]
MSRDFGAKGADDVVVVYGRTFPSYSRSEIHPAISKIVEPFARGTLLDFPSGTGSLAWRLKNEGFAVAAADIAPEAFVNPEIEIRRGDLNGRFPYDARQFDYACFVEGPEHVENVFHCLREFARVLKPGGRLIVSLPNYSNLQNRFKQFLNGVVEPVVSYESLKTDYAGTEFMIHINRLPYPMMRMALEFAGFKVESVHQDRPKKKQRLLWPIAWFIQALTYLRGEKGQKKYWLKDNNASQVLMGGNTLILVARLIDQPPTGP